MNERVKESVWMRWGVGGALCMAALLKAILLWAKVVPFNADEAIVALMARHILAGARPLFFYGQAYLGSLDAWLIAGGFALFGQDVWVIRLVQILLYLGTMWTTAKLGEKIFSRKVGILVAWVLAIPVVNVTLYTTATLGGYGEALLLGNLTLLLAIKMKETTRFIRGQWFLLGVLVGFGLWVFGLTLVFSAPAGLFLLWHLITLRKVQKMNFEGSVRSKEPQILFRISTWLTPLFYAGGGFLLGALPYWAGAGQVGGGQVAAELGGSAIAGVEGVGWLAQVGQHLVNLLLLGTSVIFGFRPPWEVRWLGLPLIPFMVMFWVWVLARTVRMKKTSGIWLLIGTMLTLGAGFVFTPFGADPSGRYFLPLVVPLALFAAAAVSGVKHPRGQVALMAVLVGYALIGTWQVARENPPGITTQFDAVTWLDKSYDDALIAFLQAHGETRGYTNYWVAYPLAFLSGEDLVFIPALPYHLDFRYTARDDRYAPYDEVVAQAERVAFITTNHPPLEARLRMGFGDLGVTWEEAQIGSYHVFYNLSRPVRPEEVDLSP
ncbi:MAG: glycosyltransferase family 39 protein [Anaerolineales bacterium]|nr:glycosyltransferase family 39 protein [Anaerolineales bacterium]